LHEKWLEKDGYDVTFRAFNVLVNASWRWRGVTVHLRSDRTQEFGGVCPYQIAKQIPAEFLLKTKNCGTVTQREFVKFFEGIEPTYARKIEEIKYWTLKIKRR